MLLVENAGTLSNANFQIYGGGIMLTLASGTSVTASLKWDMAASQQFSDGSNRRKDYCSSLSVNDINVDRYGNPLGSPKSGYLCSFSFGTYLFIPATGESRLLSLYSAAGWSPTDPKLFTPAITPVICSRSPIPVIIRNMTPAPVPALRLILHPW